MTPRHAYEQAATEGSDDEGRPFIGEKGRGWKGRGPAEAFNRIIAFVNVVLALALAASLAMVARSMTGRACEREVLKLEPYSPVLEAVRPVIKRFKPELVFQSEPSDEVDQAWQSIQGDYEGAVALPADMANKVTAAGTHETLESPFEHGKFVYGMSMFHQLHCLDIIRKSFYRDRYFPGVPDEKFQFHRNHCFDFLRQTIQCHGDVGLIYWWNKNFTDIDDPTKRGGRALYSDWYKGMNASERWENSFISWDIEHKCRAWEPIDEWVNAHPPWPKDVDVPRQLPECETFACRILRGKNRTLKPGGPT